VTEEMVGGSSDDDSDEKAGGEWVGRGIWI